MFLGFVECLQLLLFSFYYCLLTALNNPNPIITQLVAIKAMYKGICPIERPNNNPIAGAISLKANSSTPPTKISDVVILDFCLYPIPNDMKNNIIEGIPINGPPLLIG